MPDATFISLLMSLLSKLPNISQRPLGRILDGDGLTPATATELEAAAANATKGKAPVHPFTINGSSGVLPQGTPSGFPGLKGLSQSQTDSPPRAQKALDFLAADTGIFNESLKAQVAIQDLILLPQRIFVFIITYVRYFTVITTTIFSPSFGLDDLENLLTDSLPTVIKTTYIAALSTLAIAWFGFFFGVFAFAVCLAAIPLFFTAVSALGLEVLGVQFIRRQK